MDTIREREIVRFLAEGVDLFTGEVLANESIYHHPEVIRALYTVLDATAPKLVQLLDPYRNAGKPGLTWKTISRGMSSRKNENIRYSQGTWKNL